MKTPPSTRTHGAPRRGNAGFTLIEIMVALVIFAIGALSLALLMPLGTKKITTAGSQSVASEQAAAAAEHLLGLPYDDGDLDAGAHTDPANPRSGKTYVTWGVELDTPITDCKRVTVQVNWPTAASTNKVKLVIIVPRSGG